MAGTPAGIIMNSRFLSYGKETRKPMRVWIHYPLWVCERNVVVKEKTPFHTWMRQCRKSGNKKCGFSIRVNAMITDFFLFLYHQVGYLQVNNLSNL